MKTFQEFVSTTGGDSGIFSQTGIGQGDIANTVRSLDRLKVTGKDSKVVRFVMSKFRPLVRKLIEMGANIGDLPVVLQAVEKLMQDEAQGLNPTFNRSRLTTALKGSAID